MAVTLRYYGNPPRRLGAPLNSRKWLQWGGALLGISAPCLLLMGIELLASSIARSMYRIQPIYEWHHPTDFGGHRIDISKKTTGGEGGPLAVFRVKIDGLEYAVPSVKEFGCDWYGSREDRLETAYVTEHATGKRFLAIAEHFDAWPRSVYRIIRLDADGSIVQEVFTSANRRSPIYRWMLLFDGWMGYVSNVLVGWPSLIYPIMYPFLTGPIGLVMVLVGLVVRRQQRIAANS